MRILHVASFAGNIGDNASHIGLVEILGEYFKDINIERLEIRKFYKNYQHEDKQVFDLQFIKYANKFDMLVIGGGGFLDYWVEGSATGTTVDMAPSLVGSIEVPTLICSVGCMPHKNVPEGNIEKFRQFLDAVEENPKVRIALRNDGSIQSIRDDVGIQYLSNIPEVLDNGFFFDTDFASPLHERNKYIAINVTCDQLKMKGLDVGSIDKSQYLSSLSQLVDHVINNMGYEVIFVPHIYSDLIAISEVLEMLDDFVVRQYVSVAPCLQHDEGAKAVFSVYKNSELVIGSRFHANVCSIAMGVPAVGLAALSRVKYVYDQLGMTDSYVTLGYDFSIDLIYRVEYALQHRSEIKSKINEELIVRRAASRNAYFNIFNSLGFEFDCNEKE